MRKIKSTKKTAKKKLTKKRKSSQKEFSWKRFVFKMAFILFFVILIYVLLYSKLTSINKIEVNGNSIIDSSLIDQKINFQIQEKNLLNISKSNFFFISENKLQKIILNSFPKIKNADVKKVFPNQINVSIVEHDLIPVVCIESQEGRCFILEKDGRIIGEANFDSLKLKENEIVIIIDKNKNDIVEIGKEFISEKKLANIIFLGEELTYALNTKIKQPYIIPARGASEARFDASEGWYLQVDTVDDPDITLKVINLFFEKGLKEGVKRYDLEYIDIRTNEKIYYKYDKSVVIIEDEKDKEDLVEKNDDKN